MTFKGSEIVETMMVRKIVTEMICDVVIKNAGYMHYIHSEGLPLLMKALQTGGPKDEIKEMLHNIETKMDFLFRLFKRHSDFLEPLRLMQNT